MARELTRPAPRRRFAPLFPLPHHRLDTPLFPLESCPSPSSYKPIRRQFSPASQRPPLYCRLSLDGVTIVNSSTPMLPYLSTGACSYEAFCIFCSVNSSGIPSHPPQPYKIHLQICSRGEIVLCEGAALECTRVTGALLLLALGSGFLDATRSLRLVEFCAQMNRIAQRIEQRQCKTATRERHTTGAAGNHLPHSRPCRGVCAQPREIFARRYSNDTEKHFETPKAQL